MIEEVGLEFLKLAVAAILGGWIANYFRMRYGRSRKAQDWRAERFAEAYTLLSEALEQVGMSEEDAFEKKKKLEQAINLVDLYGDKVIKAAARKIVDAYISQDAWVIYDELRLLLRDGFRKEMGLEKLVDPPLRIEFQCALPPNTSCLVPASGGSGRE